MCFSSGRQHVSKLDVSLACMKETYCISASLIAVVVVLGSAHVLSSLLDHLCPETLLFLIA